MPNVSADDLRLLRKHFEDNPDALTLENYKKLIKGGDVVRNVFIMDAMSEGMTKQEAEKLYDSAFATAGRTSRAELEEISDFTDKELSEKDEDVEADIKVAKQARDLPKPKDKRGLVAAKEAQEADGFTVSETPAGSPAGPVDTGATDEEILADIESSQTPDRALEGPALDREIVGEPSAEDIKAKQASESELDAMLADYEKGVKGEDRIIEPDETPEPTGTSPKTVLEGPEMDKLLPENKHDLAGGAPIKGEVKKEAEDDRLAPWLKRFKDSDKVPPSMLPGGAQATGMAADDKVDPETGADMATTRMSAINEFGKGATLGAAPAMSRAQHDTVSPLTPKETLSKVEPQVDFSKLSPAEAVTLAGAFGKGLKADPGHPKLDKDGKPVLGEDGRPIMVGKVELNLTPEEQQLIARAGIPQMFGGSGHQETERKSGEEFKTRTPREQDEAMIRGLMKEWNEATRGATPEQRAEQEEELKDKLFGTKLDKLEAKGERDLALSAIDRKRMIDHIVKGIGQFAAGAVGQWGFNRPVPVGEKFKYETQDFTPEKQAEFANFTNQIKKIDEQAKLLEQMQLAPSEKSKRAEQLSKMIGYFANYATKNAATYGQNTETRDIFFSALKQMMILQEELRKWKKMQLDAKNARLKQPHRTNIKIDASSSTVNKQGREDQVRTELSERDRQRLEALGNPDRFKEFWEEPVSKRKEAFINLMRDAGLQGQAEKVWAVYQDHVKENGDFADAAVANMAFNKWASEILRTGSAKISQSDSQAVSTTNKRNAPATPQKLPDRPESDSDRAIREAIESADTKKPAPTMSVPGKPAPANQGKTVRINLNGKVGFATTGPDGVIYIRGEGISEKFLPGDPKYKAIEEQLSKGAVEVK